MAKIDTNEKAISFAKTAINHRKGRNSILPAQIEVARKNFDVKKKSYDAALANLRVLETEHEANLFEIGDLTNLIENLSDPEKLKKAFGTDSETAEAHYRSQIEGYTRDTEPKNGY